MIPITTANISQQQQQQQQQQHFSERRASSSVLSQFIFSPFYTGYM
jgi:hypothetical protein